MAERVGRKAKVKGKGSEKDWRKKLRRCEGLRAGGLPIRSDSLFIIRRAHLRCTLRLVFMGSSPDGLYLLCA